MITIAPNVKGLIFDCDGTLADTMPLHYEAWYETLASRGLSFPQAFLDARKGMPTTDIIAQFNQTFGHSINAVSFSEEKQRRFKAKLSRIKPIPVVVDLARQSRDRLPMAVATGGTQSNVSLILEAIGLRDLFDVVLTADDPIKPKPSPDIFLEAAERIGVQPRYCQVFEDGDCGLEAAQKAGMITTDVRPFV